MDYLRWVLVLVGVVLLAGIYLAGRYRKRHDRVKSHERLDTQHEVGDPLFDDMTREASSESVASDSLRQGQGEQEVVKQPEPEEHVTVIAEPEEVPPVEEAPPVEEVTLELELQVEEKIISFHLIAPEGEQLSGRDLQLVFDVRGYEYGDMDIFHYMKDGRKIFSVVNGVEPGWFDLESMDGMHTPSILLFMRLPGPLAPVDAFDLMLLEGYELSKAFGALLTDHTKSPLSEQGLQLMRDDINHYMLSLGKDSILD